MFTDKEIRAAYSKFRKQFRQRMKEFEESEYAGSGVLDEAREVFGPTGNKAEILSIIHRLQSITKWLQTAESTVEGMREADRKRIETLQDKGMSAIQTPADLINFGKFMKAIRPYFDKQRYNSEQAVELFEFAQINNVSIPNLQRHFKWYVENQAEIEEADLSPRTGKNRGKVRKKSWTAKQLSDRLGLDYDNGERIY